jgi:hypothetical protein
LRYSLDMDVVKRGDKRVEAEEEQMSPLSITRFMGLSLRERSIWSLYSLI